MSQAVNPKLEIKKDSNRLVVERQSNQKMYRELHGLTRNLIANMVTGVSKGYERTLDHFRRRFSRRPGEQDKPYVHSGLLPPGHFPASEGDYGNGWNAKQTRW